ncbi:MAG: hypothetical protein K2K28_03340, partial [Clostridia bacterium]|nr:hypothetical protein [Clostridia bacterium]
MIIENFIIGCVLIGLVFTGYLIPIIWGAIKKCKCVKTVEYFPPKGASPMDVLLKYYGRRANARNIFNPLMLYMSLIQI